MSEIVWKKTIAGQARGSVDWALEVVSFSLSLAAEAIAIVVAVAVIAAGTHPCSPLSSLSSFPIRPPAPHPPVTVWPFKLHYSFPASISPYSSSPCPWRLRRRRHGYIPTVNPTPTPARRPIDNHDPTYVTRVRGQRHAREAGAGDAAWAKGAAEGDAQWDREEGGADLGDEFLALALALALALSLSLSLPGTGTGRW